MKEQLESLQVFIHPELKQAFRIECAKRNQTMKEAIEAYIMEITATKPRIKKAA